MKGMFHSREKVFKFGFTGSSTPRPEAQLVTLKKVIKKLKREYVKGILIKGETDVLPIKFLNGKWLNMDVNMNILMNITKIVSFSSFLCISFNILYIFLHFTLKILHFECKLEDF